MITAYQATETFRNALECFSCTYRCRFSGLTVRIKRYTVGKPATVEAWLDNGNMKWSGANWWAPSYCMGYRNDPIDRLPEVTAPELSAHDRYRLEHKRWKEERGY